MWPLQNEVHVPQGRERRIKPGAERKHVTGVSGFFACILSFTSACYFSAFAHEFQHSLFSRRNSRKRSERFVAGACWRGWFKLINALRDLFVFAGCMNASRSASVIGRSHVMEILVDQPPNCAVCSLSALSGLQKRLMVPLIGCGCCSVKIQIAFLCWPCLKVKAETPLMFNHLKHIESENTLTFFHTRWQVHKWAFHIRFIMSCRNSQRFMHFYVSSLWD